MSRAGDGVRCGATGSDLGSFNAGILRADGAFRIRHPHQVVVEGDISIAGPRTLPHRQQQLLFTSGGQKSTCCGDLNHTKPQSIMKQMQAWEEAGDSEDSSSHDRSFWDVYGDEKPWKHAPIEGLTAEPVVVASCGEG